MGVEEVERWREVKGCEGEGRVEGDKGKKMRYVRLKPYQNLTRELTSSSNILFLLSSLLLVCNISAFFLSSFLLLSLLSFSSFSNSASY